MELAARVTMASGSGASDSQGFGLFEGFWACRGLLIEEAAGLPWVVVAAAGPMMTSEDPSGQMGDALID